VRRGVIDGHPEWRWHEVTPDLEKVRLTIGLKPGGGTLDAMAPTGAVVMINGGYFDDALKPTTWVKDGDKEHHGKNAKAKNSGVLIAPSDQRRGAWVGALEKAPAKPAFVVQNSPMLLDGRGRIVAPPKNLHRAARTVACASETKPKDKPRPLKLIVILASPGVGPTLHETAELLKKPVDEGGFGCRVALNLDGGPSSGIWYGAALTAGGAESQLPLLPVGYGIALVPK
jgi:hypothetical protein